MVKKSSSSWNIQQGLENHEPQCSTFLLSWSPILKNLFGLLTAANKLAQDHVSGEPTSPTLLLLQRTLSAQWGWLLSCFMECDSPSITSCAACFHDHLYLFKKKMQCFSCFMRLFYIVITSTSLVLEPKLGFYIANGFWNSWQVLSVPIIMNILESVVSL